MLGEEIVFLVLDHFRLELFSSLQGEQGNTPSVHICYEVDCIVEKLAEMEPCHIIEGPYKLDNGWRTVFVEGENKEIIEYLQTCDAKPFERSLEDNSMLKIL